MGSSVERCFTWPEGKRAGLQPYPALKLAKTAWGTALTMDIGPVGGGPDPSPGHTSDLSQKWTALGRLSPRRPAARGVLYVNILPWSLGPPCFPGACSATLTLSIPPTQVAKTKQQIEEQRVQVQVVERAQQVAVQEQEIARREKELEARVRKPAEAERYKLERLAEAEK